MARDWSSSSRLSESCSPLPYPAASPCGYSVGSSTLLRVVLDAIGGANGPSYSIRSSSPNLQGAERIGDLWASPKTRSLAELLPDAEEDRLVRALLVGMLKEQQHGGWQY
jgi:hypothetical protein